MWYTTSKLVATDRPTDRPTDLPTDIVLYRAAIAAKNISLMFPPKKIASYCNKLFRICHLSIFYTITIEDNNNLTKI